MAISTETITTIATYFSIIHHTKGRIRVRVNPKIKKEAEAVSLSEIERLPERIQGIKSLKINKAVASVTVQYDPNIFPPHLWEDLIVGKNLPEITERINELAKEIAS